MPPLTLISGFHRVPSPFAAFNSIFAPFAGLDDIPRLGITRHRRTLVALDNRHIKVTDQTTGRMYLDLSARQRTTQNAESGIARSIPSIGPKTVAQKKKLKMTPA